MESNSPILRRKFLKKSTLGTGILGIGASKSSGYSADVKDPIFNKGEISPREPLVLSVTTNGLENKKDTCKRMVERLEYMSSYKPDIICLPEAFANTAKKAEAVPGPTTEVFTAFAKEHNCYIICPIHSKRNNKIYNTAVLIDRKGNVAGMYDKIHPTEGECESGTIPGNSPPQVFKTDFGRIGILICFDINWMDEWRALKEQGAEIVFWTAVYPGGRMLSSFAWFFQYYVVGCSWRDPALIYDLSGDFISKSGTYEHWALARLNLEKIHCEIDFHVKKVKQIRKKYGRKVDIKYYHDEDWVTIESRSPDLKIQEIIDEYGLVNHWDYIKRAEKYQKKFR